MGARAIMHHLTIRRDNADYFLMVYVIYLAIQFHSISNYNLIKGIRKLVKAAGSIINIFDQCMSAYWREQLNVLIVAVTLLRFGAEKC